ncbi:MAG: glycerol-3-phosphate cytidylyltransferase [Alphaproteobacteria bacterium]|nr:glycerol-3-phosphate cytidylyltransferase [Alphaproteobacteria bacterium]
MKKERIYGFTASTFDLFHAGHIVMLEEAKKQCDWLIVGIQIDPTIDRPLVKNKPIQSIIERQIQVSACKYVDDIVVYNTEKNLEDILMTYPIDVRIIGEEYKDKEFTGKDICERRNIRIYYNSRAHYMSSTDLRKRVFEAELKKRNQNA